MLKMRLMYHTHGFIMAMMGMREPYKTTEKGDSRFNNRFEEVGPKDLELAKRLALAGSTHAKYRRMIQVWVEVTAPLYWWKEFDTYKVGTVANSESTMHTIAKRPFELDDFSYEHLMGSDENPNYMLRAQIRTKDYDDGVMFPLDLLDKTCQMLNACRDGYLCTKDEERKKEYWWQMIQLLPSSYNQTRMICLNYEVLSHIYADRRNHKLDEWHTFCDWIEELPHAKEIIFPEKEEESVDDRKKLQLEVGKAVNTGIANILYRKFALNASEIANAMDIPESVARRLIETEEEV